MASRTFSTTTAAYAAAEVKSLGVIGAGQMVGGLWFLNCYNLAVF